MNNMDRYAYSSKLKKAAPLTKLVFSMLTLLVCIWADSIPIAILILLMMGWCTVSKGGTPFQLFARLMLVPMTFLMIGVLTVGIQVGENKELFMASIPLFGTNAGVTQQGLLQAARLFFKALGAVSCLYFLSLNTPVVDLLAVLRKLRVPKLIVELMGLIYRFIFVLLDTADIMHTAQSSRLGYSGIASGYRSLAGLASTLFIRSYKRSDQLFIALEARGYSGELNVLEEHFETQWTEFIGPVAINLFLVFFALFLKSFAGGVLQ